ncbi:hypothetical protein ABBQ32_003181 [Trebouxia sp. C0010 RCD-2024]
MSRSTDQLPSRGKQRPHSFDIGLQERQGHQSTTKSRGVYKFGDGTFMFASTSMATALDNLQYYPKATAAQLTIEHRATIRETVIRQLAPLQNFPKAHSYPSAVIEPFSPASSHLDRRSAEIRCGALDRLSVDNSCRPDSYPLTRPAIVGFPPASDRTVSPFAPSTSAWPPATQVALAAQRGSTDIAHSAQIREQQIASAAASSFFAPAVVKPAATNGYEPSNVANPSAFQAPAAAASVMSHSHVTPQPAAAAAAASAFFAPAQVSTRKLGGSTGPGMGVGMGTSNSSVHRNHAPPLHGKTPSGASAAGAAAKPQYTRATRGSFDQPQTHPRSSCEQLNTRGRTSFDRNEERGSFEQAHPRGRSSFEQPHPSFQGSMTQPQMRGSFEHTCPGGRSSFEDNHNSLRSSIEQLHLAGRSNVAQLQAAARSSFEQLQSRAMPSQTVLRAIPEQSVPEQPPIPDEHSLSPFSRLSSASGQINNLPQYPFGQFVDPPCSSKLPYSLARASCDYPQPVPGSRASSEFPWVQGPFTAQLDRAGSTGTPVSRHSLMASQEFAQLDEPTKRRAAAAALGVTNLPPNQFWPEHHAGPGVQPNLAGSPFSLMDSQSYQPHALQIHALNALNALSRSAQPPLSQADFWRQQQASEHSHQHRNGFPATSVAFPPTPSGTSLRRTSATPFSNWSPGDFDSPYHSRQNHDGTPARSALSEVGANASDLQGAWGAHLDAGVHTPSKGGSARGQSYNPFLQPQSTFSIREAKLQLQNPTPRDFSEGGGRPIPRVETFASNLHDSWGAHALHDSPPMTEGGTLQDPPRLSTESLRSATSQASKASSGARGSGAHPSCRGSPLSAVWILSACVNFEGVCRPISLSNQGSGKFHHGYGYDPSSDGWKVDCSSGSQKSFSTYTGAKPQGGSSGGIISAAKELLAEAAHAARSTDASARRTSQDGTSGISPLLDLLVQPDTPLLKKRRVLETLTFLAANPAIAHSICEQGGVALLLQVVAGPNEGVQLEAAETLQALMTHNCAQVAFDQSDGLFTVVPMLSQHLEPIAHLAGLHILASFIYCRRRRQDEMAHQLNEAGLYKLALTLLKNHSQSAGRGNSSIHRDTLDWLEASQVGSPMAPLPEDHPIHWEARGNLDNAKGNSAQHPFQSDPMSQSCHPQLKTAQTLPPPNFQSLPATIGHSPLLRQYGGHAVPDEEEANGGTERAGRTDVAEEEDSGGISGDTMLADQVVLAALEVLFKLASDPHHLQAFRPELVMEALAAQLQHGRHPRTLVRAIQLLQACTHQPALLLACAQSECIRELVHIAQGSGYVASLASGTLGVLVRSDAVRTALLERNGTRPIVSMLSRTDVALPGALYLLSSLAEFSDSRQSMLHAGVVPALTCLANKTSDAHTCASATSLLRLLTHSTDRRSTDGIHGSGLDTAGNFGANAAGAGGNTGRGMGGYQGRGPPPPAGDMYRQHGSHAFQGFFQI